MKTHLPNLLSNEQESSKRSIFVLFSSLYLVVLSFFIWLNTVATQDNTREARVMLSLGEKFSDAKALQELRSSLPKMFNYEMVLQQNLDEIDSHVRTSFADAKEIDIIREKASLTVSIPLYLLFQSDQVIMRYHQKKFLKDVADILTRNNKNLRMNTRIQIISKKYLKSEFSYEYNLDILRLGYVIQRLVGSGVERNNLIGGVASGDENKLVIQVKGAIFDD